MDEMEKKIEQKVEKAVTKWVEILVSAIVTFVVIVVVVKFAWSWVIADLFPGAVAQGLISAELTWVVTAKFAIFVSILTGIHQSLSEVFKPKK
jgi:hypothetical protein